VLDAILIDAGFAVSGMGDGRRRREDRFEWSVSSSEDLNDANM